MVSFNHWIRQQFHARIKTGQAIVTALTNGANEYRFRCACPEHPYEASMEAISGIILKCFRHPGNEVSVSSAGW